jgi:hypothetical protein
MNTQKKFTRLSLLALIALVFSFQANAQHLTDAAIKTNVSPIENPLKLVRSMQPLSFEYNTSQYRHLKLPSGTRYGFIAEDFQRVMPGLVYNKPYTYLAGKNSTRNATIKGIDMESLIPVLIASIKEQQAQIDQLKAEIELLKNK